MLSNAPIAGLYSPSPNCVTETESHRSYNTVSTIRTHHTPSGRSKQNVRRRASFNQGRPLEVLAHAAEYLIDSRMYLIDEPATSSDAEATQLLMRLSREIFSECVEIIPPTQRLRHWISNRLAVGVN